MEWSVEWSGVNPRDLREITFLGKIISVDVDVER
jgi:hypothetical protein